MGQLRKPDSLSAIAAEAFDAIRNTRQVATFSSRPGGLTNDQAYRVSALVRQMYEASGSRVVGRKIGFTNRTIWPQYGVYAPIWGYVLDSTVYDLAVAKTLSLDPFSEPRIEPEIIFGLGAAPSAQMNDASLCACIEWIALGFEIVQSIFPDWRFSAPDTVTSNSLHGALLTGPRHPFAPRAAEWLQSLSDFDIDLSCNGHIIDKGNSRNVLEGPLSALRHLIELLAHDPVNPALSAGEIVSTGTLTKAMPIARGETWAAKPTGIDLDEISLHFS